MDSKSKLSVFRNFRGVISPAKNLHHALGNMEASSSLEHILADLIIEPKTEITLCTTLPF